MSSPAREFSPCAPVAAVQPRQGHAGDAHGLTDQFLSAFSHELRTPLNAIVGYADLLANEVGPRLDAEAKRSLDAITRSAARLTTLLNDTLDLARLRMVTIYLTNRHSWATFRPCPRRKPERLPVRKP